MDNILLAYGFSNHLRRKRKNIQRKIIFEKPVYGISIDTILSDNSIERTDLFTDNSTKLENFNGISDFELEKLNEAYYYRLSDLIGVSTYRLKRETELPYNAVKELKKKATSEREIPFELNENVIESKNEEEVMNKLSDNSDWIFLFTYELSLKRECISRVEDLLNEELNSRRELIDYLIEDIYKPESFIGELKELTGASEKYIKDVISGRIEYGLSESERDNILERDDYKCRNCDEESSLEVHHIIPISQGGTKSDNNLCTLCKDCHFSIAHGENTSQISYNNRDEFWDVIE